MPASRAVAHILSLAFVAWVRMYDSGKPGPLLCRRLQEAREEKCISYRSGGCNLRSRCQQVCFSLKPLSVVTFR